MNEFRYTLDSEGNVIAAGFMAFENAIIGNEPFENWDIMNWKKSLITGEWVRIPIEVADIKEIEI